MNMARLLAPLSVCLGLLTVLAIARSAAAQTYVWTDEHGVVHAAADPGEVPAKYRTKSVQDAERPHSNSKLTVLPPPDAPAAAEGDAADPTAPAPMKPGHKPAYAPAPKTEAPAEPTAAAPPSDTDEPVKPKGLGEPEKGFEWHCTPDPDGGKPKCEQFEKRSSKRDRHAAARDTARKQMGVDPDAENDPEVKAELQRRADKEYEKTTKKPPAPKRGSDDDDESGDSD
jgi:hypothetical protein